MADPCLAGAGSPSHLGRAAITNGGRLVLSRSCAAACLQWAGAGRAPATPQPRTVVFFCSGRCSRGSARAPEEPAAPSGRHRPATPRSSRHGSNVDGFQIPLSSSRPGFRHAHGPATPRRRWTCRCRDEQAASRARRLPPGPRLLTASAWCPGVHEAAACRDSREAGRIKIRRHQRQNAQTRARRRVCCTVRRARRARSTVSPCSWVFRPLLPPLLAHGPLKRMPTGHWTSSASTPVPASGAAETVQRP